MCKTPYLKHVSQIFETSSCLGSCSFVRPRPASKQLPVYLLLSQCKDKIRSAYPLPSQKSTWSGLLGQNTGSHKTPHTQKTRKQGKQKRPIAFWTLSHPVGLKSAILPEALHTGTNGTLVWKLYITCMNWSKLATIIAAHGPLNENILKTIIWNAWKVKKAVDDCRCTKNLPKRFYKTYKPQKHCLFFLLKRQGD